MNINIRKIFIFFSKINIFENSQFWINVRIHVSLTWKFSINTICSSTTNFFVFIEHTILSINSVICRNFDRSLQSLSNYFTRFMIVPNPNSRDPSNPSLITALDGVVMNAIRHTHTHIYKHTHAKTKLNWALKIVTIHCLVWRIYFDARERSVSSTSHMNDLVGVALKWSRWLLA